MPEQHLGLSVWLMPDSSVGQRGGWNVLSVRPLDWKTCWFPGLWPWWLALDVKTMPRV